MKRLALVVLAAVLAVPLAAAFTACGPKEDKPPMMPDEPAPAEPGDASPG